MKCPECNSFEITLEPYDASDAESGYRDFGYQWRCRSCGAISTEQEMGEANAN